MVVHVKAKDRQTGKVTILRIEAKNTQEAKQIAMRDYVRSYEIL